jgi:hypothetical protein
MSATQWPAEWLKVQTSKWQERIKARELGEGTFLLRHWASNDKAATMLAIQIILQEKWD